MTLAEMHSYGALVELNEKGLEISVREQDPNGCMQSPQRFLHQLGDVPVAYHTAAPHGRKTERRRNEANCF